MKTPSLSIFKGKRVFLTGDTGFKGAWLAFWLHELGAKVYGYALPPERSIDLFNELKLGDLIRHHDADIRDSKRLAKTMAAFKPQFVFHLAAQALVRRSYAQPKETFETNVIGSANILAAVRACPSVRSLVYVTSDKCYRNKNLARGYREDDELGGGDPYSASKACAELVFSSYRDCFFKERPGLGAASARAGNVIGGGDWAEDRIVPDVVTALSAGKKLVLRSPKAVRPWQHVLDPLTGYLFLAARLYENPRRYAGAWNFGPDSSESRTVLELAQSLAEAWGARPKIAVRPSRLFEARVLRLDATKARRLGWAPRWNFAASVRKTAGWYKALSWGSEARELCRRQIGEYLRTWYNVHSLNA